MRGVVPKTGLAAAPWPVPGELYEGDDDGCFDAAVTVLGDVRRAKSEAKVSLKRPVARLDFPYRLAGRRFPDRAPVLVAHSPAADASPDWWWEFGLSPADGAGASRVLAATRWRTRRPQS